MKFGKRLKKQVEESLPEWRDKFLAYKRLKRLVRLVPADPSAPRRRRAAAEAAFVRLLDGEVDRFNAFFLEREEDFVIRHRARRRSSRFHAFSFVRMHAVRLVLRRGLRLRRSRSGAARGGEEGGGGRS